MSVVCPIPPASQSPFDEPTPIRPDIGTDDPPTREWRPMMPPDLFTPEIGVDGMAVYGVLALYVDGKTGECWPSQSIIAARTGISRERVIRAIKRLEQHGFVEVEHQDNRGMKRVNLYRLPHQIHAYVPMSQNTTTMSQNGTADVPNPDSRCPKMGHKLNVIELNDIEPIKEPPVVPQKTAEKKTTTYPPEMDAFWDSYPAIGRTRSSKKQVRDEWRRIRPDPATATDIIASLDAWKKTSDWKRGFALGAHLFLSRRKWEEIPEPAQHVEGIITDRENPDVFGTWGKPSNKKESTR